MLEKLETLHTQALAELDAVRDRETLAAWKSRYIGGKGEVSLMMRGIGGLRIADASVHRFVTDVASLLRRELMNV